MSAPKEIYILQGKKDGGFGCAWHDHFIESNTCDCIKYIRADLDKEIEREMCSQAWWEDRGWIMIPPNVTLKGIESLLLTVRNKIKLDKDREQ